jgi:hypothetical protein
MFTIAIAAIAMLAPAALAAEKEAAVSHEGVSSVASGGAAYHATSKYLDATLSLTRPQFLYLSLDSLGRERFRAGVIQRSAAIAASPPTVARHAATSVEYRRPGLDASTPARWTIDFNAEGLTMISRWSQADPPEPIVLEFNPKLSRATLLGMFNPDGSVRLPAILHLPDQGTVRITAADTKEATLGYDAQRTGAEFIRVVFPPATEKRPQIEYRWQVVAIAPRVLAVAKDRRFDGFRRNWLNILQLSPRRRALANNTASDTCALCYYEYADVARNTPPLAEGLTALDLIRQTLDRILAGGKTYGMPNYIYDLPPNNNYPQPSLDTYPSLLIAAWDYVDGSNDGAWLANNYAGVKQWAEKMLAQDHDGNGLIEYHASGNSGSWAAGPFVRPANWWDTVGYGHEDAYSNALAYRALRGMTALAKRQGKADDAARYTAAAGKLHDAYFNTFYNPDSGVLAGWKSADGKLHDYYFLPVNGIAIHYGLVPKDEANAIMDKLMAKMKEVGYTRFDLGLPGNLVPVLRKDYVDTTPRFGGGVKEDNSDGFQIYENGGATACHAFHTLAALYDLGRRGEADRILLPMLDSFEKGSFEGMGANGMSNDWKAWDGTPWGYEGFLTDGYYALMAVLLRDGSLKMMPPP